MAGITCLQPYKNYISITFSIMSVLLNLSPIINFVSICRGKEKYTNIPTLMLFFGVLNNALWGCYWGRKNELSPCLCSVVCCIFATIYFSWYFYFVSNKSFGKFIFYVLCQIAIEIGVIFLFYIDLIELYIIGILLIGINTFQYASPMQNLLKVIRERNHKLIPIVFTILGAICAGGWFLFGATVGDINSMISNGLGCLSSIITILVWLYIYVKYGNKEKEEEKEEEKDEIIEKGDDEEL